MLFPSYYCQIEFQRTYVNLDSVRLPAREARKI